jgi:hypothetical protein
MNRALFACCIGALAASQHVCAQNAAPDDRPSLGWVAGLEHVTQATMPLEGTSITIGALADFPLANRHFSVRSDILFHVIGLGRAGSSTPDVLIETDPGFVASGSLGVVAYLNDRSARWSPYLIGGAAAYLYDGDHFGFAHTNHFGLEGGAGVEFRAHNHDLFFEARYFTMAPFAIVPFVFGIRY